MSELKRIFVEKKTEFAVAAKKIQHDLVNYLLLPQIKQVRIIIRYDIEGMSKKTYESAKQMIFSEPPIDHLFEENFPQSKDEIAFAISYLPGQYDQRADSAAQCVRMISPAEVPTIKLAQIVVIKANLTEEELRKIKSYLINPVDSKEVSLQKPKRLQEEIITVTDVPTIHGFNSLSAEELQSLLKKMELAMNGDDLLHIQRYFLKEEQREPTLTEIKVLDTYWSDHCRHTTFMTELEVISVGGGKFGAPIKNTLQRYMEARKRYYGNQPKKRCLMDLAVITAKELIRKGTVTDIEVSAEINACSIVVAVDVDGNNEEWLVMFKNETHNHPTEIEPFGGAATCIGGCIRDPLSGRAYAYQAMRITGAGDPRKTLKETLKGKLPQKKITTEAAHGYSSYGNQIGIATGFVREIYHEGYIAKRMEIGAVIAATPRENVKREQPQPGDIIILVGGKTGRDGCGGATGSSKQHTDNSIHTSGAEVQKGNAPTERKIQRFFRDKCVAQMIKRCNDFGAGGVSVAIGELAAGVMVDLDKIPVKYEGLDGTELAISESQERMAVVVCKDDVKQFIKYADRENLEAVVVARVTPENRMQLIWKGKKIVDLSRDFIETNGAPQKQNVYITAPSGESYFQQSKNASTKTPREKWLQILSDLNVCSQRGLIEHFDSTVGTGSVHLPLGGKFKNTPTESMVAKIPVLRGETTTGTIMAYGFDPDLSSWSPYHAAVYAILESVAKVVAVGGDHKRIRLTLQEYFKKLGNNEECWGSPLSSLLGAFSVQQGLGIPAIGGKDSMSGTFEQISVPPTLVSFAVTSVDIRKVVSPELKKRDSFLVYIPLERDKYELPDFSRVSFQYSLITKRISEGKILSAHTVTKGGIAAALSKMAFGNLIGFKLDNVDVDNLYTPDYGSLVVEISKEIKPSEIFEGIHFQVMGRTNSSTSVELPDGTLLDLAELLSSWEKTLEPIFPTKIEEEKVETPLISSKLKPKIKAKIAHPSPRVFIPVFPGTNCEYDLARAFSSVGAIADIFVLNNLTPAKITQTLTTIAKRINNSQIIMLPGGFSAGDEPEGSAKFIAAVFRHHQVKMAVMNLLNQRDGLILGICNGFQALIKLGLLPNGKIQSIKESDPTLTFNKIGRHVATMVRTRISSTNSPWLSELQVGDQHTIPVSHGEGRFIASEMVIKKLIQKGQIATQYVDYAGNPTLNLPNNPNGSEAAIEGILSPDGRIFGKMGHSERIGVNIALNVPGNKDQRLFQAGVKYFS